MPNERHELRCPTCEGRKLLPLNAQARATLAAGRSPHAWNGDWVECADCQATGTFVLYEHPIHHTSHSVLVKRAGG